MDPKHQKLNARQTTSGLLKKSQLFQLQGGRVKMYAYTSNEANTEDGMAQTSLKIPIFVFFECMGIGLL